MSEREGRWPTQEDVENSAARRRRRDVAEAVVLARDLVAPLVQEIQKPMVDGLHAIAKALERLAVAVEQMK
jgi:hypothetical protein